MSQNHLSQSLEEGESHFKALVAYAPGLVFQFQLDTKGNLLFIYLSDGCKALLGLEANALKKSPQQFFKMIDLQDVTRLQASIQSSATDLKLLNWEGRVWIEEWQDTKWVNMRAIPRQLQGNVLQWEGIMTNITQSKREKFELEESRKRLAELSAHLTHVKEQERSRIAREIHDDLGGNLTAIKIGLGSMMRRIPADMPKLLENAKNLEAIIDSTFEAAHRISGDLRPNILELGIVAALEWQAKQFQQQIGILCDFSANKAEAKESKEQAITMFRICQEAMSNIAKYANAKRVEVKLVVAPDALKMTILDDGVGIDAGDILKPNSFGLLGMRERAAGLNGEFSIEKLPEQGTLVSVTLPREVGANKAYA